MLPARQNVNALSQLLLIFFLGWFLNFIILDYKALKLKYLTYNHHDSTQMDFISDDGSITCFFFHLLFFHAESSGLSDWEIFKNNLFLFSLLLAEIYLSAGNMHLSQLSSVWEKKPLTMSYKLY